jgi:hypothetical protein
MHTLLAPKQNLTATFFCLQYNLAPPLGLFRADNNMPPWRNNVSEVKISPNSEKRRICAMKTLLQNDDKIYVNVLLTRAKFIVLSIQTSSTSI